MGITVAGACHARNAHVQPPCRETCAAVASVRASVSMPGEPAADCAGIAAERTIGLPAVSATTGWSNRSR